MDEAENRGNSKRTNEEVLFGVLPGAFVADLSWREVQRRLEAGGAAVLPVGAACKAHGLHLPMDTDRVQAEWLAGALVRRANVVVWPVLSYGYYPAFVEYPGSCSLSETTFEHLVSDVLIGIKRAGAARVFILNTGVSTVEPLEQVVARRTDRVRVELINVYEGPHFHKVARRLCEQPRGGHADELETSIMLAIAPERVGMGEAVCWTSETLEPGAWKRTDASHPNYSPYGVFGDPTLATAKKGHALLDAMLTDVWNRIEAAIQS